MKATSAFPAVWKKAADGSSMPNEVETNAPSNETSVPFAYRCALRNRLFVRLNRSFVRDALRAKAGDSYTYRQASSKKDGRNRKGELLWRLPSKR